jgi:hypothetical protein
VSLSPTFALTPSSPFYYTAAQNQAALRCLGADFLQLDPFDYPTLYANDQFFFEDAFAASAGVNYSVWNNRRKSRFLELDCSLQDYGPQKQLALVFGVEVRYSGPGRVLVYSDAGLLRNQVLLKGDNQFLLVIESLTLPLYLYFIHAGGFWLFKGITGYVI